MKLWFSKKAKTKPHYRWCIRHGRGRWMSVHDWLEAQARDQIVALRRWPQMEYSTFEVL